MNRLEPELQTECRVRHPGRSRAERLLLTLARAYLGFTQATIRWCFTGAPESLPSLLQAPDRPVDGCITACWHRSLLFLPAMCRWGHRQNPALNFGVMISRNRDGRFINDLVAPWGITGVEGSSDRQGKNKGGSRALRESVKAIKNGAVFAITPDGPRGPAEKVQPGTPALMRLSGSPLIPVGGACTSLRLPSWDGLRVPLPFGRGYMLYGAPRKGDASPEAIENDLKDLSAKAEHYLSAGRFTLPDHLWHLLGMVLTPGLRAMMLVRLRRGKERRERLPERRGRASLTRPTGRVLWLHAASVGETHSILPLIETLARRNPGWHFLLTSATIGGADIVAHYLGQAAHRDARIIHQFIPYDTPLWTRRFLDHWQPEALLLTDSELWPGLILSCTRRAIPVGVLNGRLSEKSWRRWHKARHIAPPLFRRLAFVAARGEEDGRHFRDLGVKDVVCLGDLKQDAPPPPVDPVELDRLRRLIAGRPVFLAASTHPGEDEIMLRAAHLAREHFPALLTIIAPRHPVRGEDIATLTSPAAPRRSAGADPAAHDAFWIADTLGELGLFYRLADCAFIGNSLILPGGGHNPFEAARLDVALVTGPFHDNFRPAFTQLKGLVETIHDETQLADWIVEVLTNPSPWKDRACRAKETIGSGHDVALRLAEKIETLCA
ncbi:MULTISPECIES: glycosyltransferase N-terminal domain-containing protein [Asaia]|uniref:glycosyltransferase N-terminal domain-containing protein n=1 Tax=Asaia TaxID=91914 RepID=UPI00255487E4|nr:glycosyltransferase N-terminal domain-containing protein [Asaia sp. HumB]MDL2169932.1 glycosyltransferase N-terminal domain-containing protein [Asaia sp. HumB]